MSTPAYKAFSAVQNLDELYKVLDDNRLTAGWHKKRPSLWKEPRTGFQPMVWRYREAALAMDKAGEWMSTEDAERRNLLMFNPVDDNDYDTTQTIVAAYQMIRPNEYARAHRHTPNALRLVLDAHPNLFTVVNGIKLPMRPGDVLLTPNWHWHSHYNEGDKNAYWIDFLDVPLVHQLEPMFFEEFPGGFQPVTSEPTDCPYVFGRDWVLSEIAKLPAKDGVRHMVLPTDQFIPTLGLNYVQIPTGKTYAPGRTTANRVFAVTSGGGSSTIGGKKFDWERGDVFAVPTWNDFEVRASEDALLFEVTDEPTQRKLNLFRAEESKR